MNREEIYTILKAAAIAAALIIGIICEALGIDMLYEKTTATIGPVSFPAALILLIIGLVLIIFALSRLSKTNRGQSPVRPWLSRIWPVLLGIVLLGIFIGTHYQFPTEDKYKILVDLIIILLGLTAAVGYGIFKWISKEVSEQVATERKLIEGYRTLTTATTLRNVGYIAWSVFDAERKRIAKAGGDLEIELEYSKELLITAIHHTKEALGYSDEALKIAQELPKQKEKYKREKYLCMSNLVYYLVERNKIKGQELDQTQKSEALDLAKDLLASVSKQNCPEDFYDIQESAAWARYHLGDDALKQKACEIVHSLLDDADIPKNWHDDITAEWASYLEKFPPKNN